MSLDALAMERVRTPQQETTVGDLRIERRDPGLESEIGDVVLEPTQSVPPDPGRKGHTVEPIGNGGRRPPPKAFMDAM